MSKKTSVAGDSHTKSKKKADVSDVVPQQVKFFDTFLEKKLLKFKIAYFTSSTITTNFS
jgi:hypothetical protein